MFLFWYWISRVTRNDRYSIYCCRIVTCTRLSFHGKPSFRLGIKHIVLTLCRRGLVILIYLHILLGFLNLLGIYIVLLSLSYYPLKDIKPFLFVYVIKYIIVYLLFDIFSVLYL